MSHPKSTNSITIEGNNHDIVGLRRLFETGASSIHVTSSLKSHTANILVCAEQEGRSVAYLTGERVEELVLPIHDMHHAKIMVDPLIDALNGLGRVYDPNFKGIKATSVTIFDGINATFIVLPVYQTPRTGSTLGHHPKQTESLKARLDLLQLDDDARLIVETLSEKPTWSAIGAAFETMRLSLEKHGMSDSRIMTSKQKTKFGNAANNITSRKEGGRHGKTKNNQKLTFSEIMEFMTLNEAIELHRQAVNRYLDFRTGHRTTYEICDRMNDEPRFGLDDYKHNC